MVTSNIIGDPIWSLAWTPTLYYSASALSTFPPGELFTGWTSDGTNITIPLSAFTSHGMTADVANEITGDARQVALSLCGRMFEWYNELETVPDAETIRLRRSAIRTTGAFIGTEGTIFELTFQTQYPEGTIAAEP